MNRYALTCWTILLRKLFEEVVAEKLRAVLQQVARLGSRGWSRSRARDFYDLWRVLGTYREDLNLNGFDALLHEKCQLRNVDFANPEDFFDSRIVASVELEWERSLGSLVPGLPAFETVIGELRSQVADLI